VEHSISFARPLVRSAVRSRRARPAMTGSVGLRGRPLHPSVMLHCMLEELEDCVASVRRVVAEVEPERISPGDADRLLSAFVALERAAVAGKLLCAARAAESNSWRQEGHSSAAGWLAQAVATAEA